MGDVVAEQKVDAGLDGGLYGGRATLDGYLIERPQGAHRPPATRQPIVGGADEARPLDTSLAVPPIPLAGDRAGQGVNSALQPLVSPEAQIQQRADHVAPQAVDGGARAAVAGEGIVLGLGVVDSIIDTTPHPLVAPIGAQLGQEEHRPQGASILRRVARPRLDPVAPRRLGIQDGGHRAGAHHICLGGDPFRVIGGPVE